MTIEAVLFDLDGTLLDTAKDLGSAINHVLKINDKTPLSFEESRPFVSGGTPALINLGFGIKIGEPGYDELKNEFLDYYESNLCEYSSPFPGIMEALDLIEQKQLTWGIVTNKPGYLTAPLLSQLALSERSSVTISGDTYEKKKPDPYPLLEAAKIIDVNPQKTLYVGDDERDIIAAKAANMISVSVGWGYPGEKDPKSWDADFHIESSEGLAEFIKSKIG